MLFYPLLLGALAISFPFLSLVGMMIFSGRAAMQGIDMPIRVIGAFFLAPAAILLWDHTGMMIPALDAIIGVGLVCLIFLLALKAHVPFGSAFTLSALAIIAYGLVRVVAWGEQLSTMHINALETAMGQMPQMLDKTMLQTTVDIMGSFWPASWMLSQLLALYLGYVLFQRSLGVKFRWSDQRFPSAYNILLVAVLPVYFVPGARIMFVNGFIALCVIPFIQGLGLLIDRLGRIVQNRLLRILVLVFLLINIISYALITLFGFADLWWNFRNIKTGGNPA
ncbi:MAG TPA: hypothetical protein PKX36_05670 [Candidatus Cloacimonadota bacterium]|nr:hypothetical protein [Candidatus Cloacimonadota bacterium]